MSSESVFSLPIFLGQFWVGPTLFLPHNLWDSQNYSSYQPLSVRIPSLTGTAKSQQLPCASFPLSDTLTSPIPYCIECSLMLSSSCFYVYPAFPALSRGLTWRKLFSDNPSCKFLLLVFWDCLSFPHWFQKTEIFFSSCFFFLEWESGPIKSRSLSALFPTLLCIQNNVNPSFLFSY